MNNAVKRKIRVRKKLKETAKNRLRLSVFKSNQNIYAQIIDDSKGFTLVSASTKDNELIKLDKKASIAAAVEVGKLIAKRAIEKGLGAIYFDRGAYLYHGKIKALADSAREAGLKF